MGKLTTHILDTARGRPGVGIPIRLFGGDGVTRLAEAVSNQDGRCNAPLLDATAFRRGTYEIEFFVADYFADIIPAEDAPFLDKVRLRVTLARDEHYHVPLLVSPWSYSTYRGS